MSPPPAMTMPSRTATVASASDTSPPGGSRTGRPPFSLRDFPYVHGSRAPSSDQPRQLALVWYVVMPIVGAICPLRGYESAPDHQVNPPTPTSEVTPGTPRTNGGAMGEGGRFAEN